MVSREDLVEYTEEILKHTLERCRKGKPLKDGFYTINADEESMDFQAFRSMGPMLNSGDGKDKLFAVCRIWIEKVKASAAIFVTEAWDFQGNDKSKTLSEEEFKAKVDAGFKRLVKEGYGKVYQSIIVQAMSPHFSVTATRLFEDVMINGKRKLVFFGEKRIASGPIENFKGRLKMYGPFTEPEVEHYYKLFKQPVVDEFFTKRKATG